MKNYKNYFLNKLIDSYEGSKNYTNSENKQNIYFRFNEKNIKALFTEPQYSSKIADTIAKETGASIYTLDPIVTGDANEDAYDDYIVKMQENLNTLKEALKW